MVDVLLVIMIVAFGLGIPGVPGYVIAKRRQQRYPGIAFIPFVGLWIVLCESLGRSGWLALLVFVPYLGALGLSIWTAISLPAHHARSRWWTAALLVPIVNLVGLWAYAFTLPKPLSPRPS